MRSFELGPGREATLGRFDRLTRELGLDRPRAAAWTYVQTLAWAFDGSSFSSSHLETAGWLRAECG